MGEKHRWTKGIGGRIKSTRSDALLDQATFGESVGITRQSVSAYETERLMPSRNEVERMADRYDSLPWWLLYGVKTGDSLADAAMLFAKANNPEASELTNA